MGKPAIKMEGLLSSAAEQQEKATTLRGIAYGNAVAAIRALESRLLQALNGGTLRGLKNLAPGVGVPLQAARIKGSRWFGIDDVLPPDESEVLVISKTGQICMARGIDLQKLSGERWEMRPARDEDFIAQDLEPVVDAVQQALERHIVRSEKTSASYERVSYLSNRLIDAMGYTAP